MALTYVFGQNVEYSQTVNLNGHLYVNNVSVDLTCPQDMTYTLSCKTKETYESSGSFVDVTNNIYSEKFQLLTDLDQKRGTWTTLSQILGEGVTSYTSRAYSPVGDYSLSNVKHFGTDITNFVCDVDAQVENQSGPYIIKNDAYTPSGAYHLQFWPGTAYTYVNIPFTVGDVVRLCKWDSSYFEEYTIVAIDWAGWYSDPYGGHQRQQSIKFDRNPPGDSQSNPFFGTYPNQWWGTYVNIYTRVSGDYGGNAFVSLGYVDSTTEFYIAGYDAVHGTHQVGRYNPNTKVFTADKTVVEGLDFFNLKKRLTVAAVCYSGATVVTMSLDGVEKVSHTYATKIQGAIGLFNYNSKTRWSDMRVELPESVLTTGSASVVDWSPWIEVMQSPVLQVQSKARQIIIKIVFVPNRSDRISVGTPTISAITVNGSYRNTYPLDDDPIWGQDSTLMWYGVTNGQTVGLPEGKYVQLRFTVRA